MILKVVKEKQIPGQDEISLVVDYYESKRFTVQDGMVVNENDKEVIDITDYSQLDEIKDRFIKYNIIEAYLMNDNGKTIERIK